MGEPAIKALASTLDNSEPSTRIKAAEALSYINTEEARQILISGLRNRDLQIIAGGVSFFVERAEPGSEPVIIEALNKYGDKEVAEILINSGNKELEQAALEWVKKGGYKLIHRGSSGPRWGGK